MAGITRTSRKEIAYRGTVVSSYAPDRVNYYSIVFCHLLFLAILTVLISLHFLGDVPKHTAQKPFSSTVNKAPRAKLVTRNVIPKNINSRNFVKSLASVAKHIHQASIHAKSLKTIAALRQATVEIKTVLQQLKLNYGNITKRGVSAPRTVCPEEFRGTQYGFDRYEKGFEMLPCENSKTLSELITILLLPRNLSMSVHDTVTDIQRVFPGVHTVLGLEDLQEQGPATTPVNPLVTQVSYTSETPEGQVWNDLTKCVQTNYILIARDVHIFDKNIRIERLIRVMEMLGFLAAGGATRDSYEGKWKLGCYQNALRNYTAVYHEGYDESVQECVVCDYTDGPFVIRTSTLLELSFDDKITGSGIFHDLFLRLGEEKLVVCSDSMFHVKPPKIQATPELWGSFANKWDIYKLKFVPGTEIIMKCNIRTRQTCAFKKNKLLHPCCVADIITMLKHVVTVCESRDVVYEVRSGTMLGAVKLNAVLPWDVDVDINFLLTNYSVVKQLIPNFSLPGHKCHVQIAPRYNSNDTLLSASFQLDSNISFWKVEIWGRASFTPSSYRTSVKRDDGRTVFTRVKMNEMWVKTAFNPGLWVRNRYGFDIFRHAQHWRSLGKLTSEELYPTQAFLECSEPGHHACLDNFNTDGNLQFSDPIP